MFGWRAKLTDLNWVGAPLKFMYRKSVRTENRSYCASAATIVAKLMWVNSSPNPTDVVEVTVPPPVAGGRFRFAVALRLANHTYGATLKVQPDALAAGCAGLVGCCARTPDVAPAASSPARTAAQTSRRAVRDALGSTSPPEYNPTLPGATFARPARASSVAETSTAALDPRIIAGTFQISGSCQVTMAWPGERVEGRARSTGVSEDDRNHYPKQPSAPNRSQSTLWQ